MTLQTLESTISKYKLYQPKEHHPDWSELNSEAIALAKQILKIMKPFTIFDKILLNKRRILAILRMIKNYMINKRRMVRGDHDFIPLFYIWTMTNQCNFTCTYCSNHRGGKYPDLYRAGENKNLTTEQAKQLIRIMKDTLAIYYCGGEPTIRKDLPELLDYSTKLNMFNMINTNGSLIGDQLAKPRYRKWLHQMDVVIISLDSLKISQLADMYVVSERVSRKILRNILTLKILQNYVPFKLVANTVITKDTIQETYDILDWCNDLGITFSPVSANIGHEPNRDLVNDPDYRKLVAKILERAGQGFPMIASKNMLDTLLYAKKITCYPVVFDHIDHTGELFWPCKSYPNAAMVNVLKYRNVDEVHKAAKKLINPSYFHGNGANQCQGHCAWIQDVITHTYGRSLRVGLFDSGIIKEIRGLV